MADRVVRCVGVSRTYQDDSIPVHALRGVDFEVGGGEFVTLAGPSGSGKSTLLNMIGGLDRPTSGRVEVDGVDLGSLSESRLSDLRLRKIGFVFQAYNLIPVLSAYENVQFILQIQGAPQSEHDSRIRPILEELGLLGMETRRPTELSGGQQQRVAIARALMNDPLFLLADEATGNLDSNTEGEILDLFDDLRPDGVTIVMVTHNPAVAERADRTLWLKDGEVEKLVENNRAAHAAEERA